MVAPIRSAEITEGACCARPFGRNARSPFRVGFLTLPERDATCENVPLALVRRVDQRFRRMYLEMRPVLTGSNSEVRSLKLLTEFYETLRSWDWYLDAGTLQRK